MKLYEFIETLNDFGYNVAFNVGSPDYRYHYWSSLSGKVNYEFCLMNKSKKYPEVTNFIELAKLFHQHTEKRQNGWRNNLEYYLSVDVTEYNIEEKYGINRIILPSKERWGYPMKIEIFIPRTWRIQNKELKLSEHQRLYLDMKIMGL